MNCRACGTQLLEGVIHCPQCGVTTPYYYSTTEAAPDDLTVASAPENVATVAQPPPPPTGYGYNPYESYESYATAPSALPPPSPQHAGNRIGIIIAIVLIVALLIGGGTFAWLQYSSAQIAAASAAHATATAQATTAAQQHFTAQGTFTILSRTNISIRQDGQNKIYDYTQQEVEYGDITGSYTVEETSIVYPDNTAKFSGTSICTCTVNGKSGTLIYSYTGTSAADGSFQGQDFDGHGTGGLAKLHGQGVFQGQGTHGTYSAQLYFAAQA